MASTDRIAILMYHSIDTSGSIVSVSPETFSRQMDALQHTGLRGTSLRAALEHRRARGCWPPQSVVLTFDDGFGNLHAHALPILSRHGFGATVFVISGHVGGRNNWAAPPVGLGDQPLLTWSQIREMASAGWEAGAHTRTHPNLQSVPESMAESEIVGSKREIEDALGASVGTFAYPYGRATDAALACVAREFEAGCTTRLSRTADEPLRRLSRIDVYYLSEPQDVARAADGRMDRYLALRRWGRWGREALARRPASRQHVAQAVGANGCDLV